MFSYSLPVWMVGFRSHICMHMHLHIYIYIHMYVCIHTSVHTMRICTSICVYIYIYTCIYMYKYIYTLKHRCIHVCGMTFGAYFHTGALTGRFGMGSQKRKPRYHEFLRSALAQVALALRGPSKYMGLSNCLYIAGVRTIVVVSPTVAKSHKPASRVQSAQIRGM